MKKLTTVQMLELAEEFLSASNYFRYIRAKRLMENEWSMDEAIKEAHQKTK